MYNKNMVEVDVNDFTNFNLEKGVRPLELAAQLLSQSLISYAKELDRDSYIDIVESIQEQAYMFIQPRRLN